MLRFLGVKKLSFILRISGEFKINLGKVKIVHAATKLLFVFMPLSQKGLRSSKEKQLKTMKEVKKKWTRQMNVEEDEFYAFRERDFRTF